MSKPVVLFDLDDTLADTRSMRDGVPMPIDEKMARMSLAPALPLLAHALALVAEGEVEVIILTARQDRDYTHAQVARYGLACGFLFRADGDNRDDHKVKADHVAALIAQGRQIVRAFDDKESNIAMFRTFGIDAVQV